MRPRQRSPALAAALLAAAVLALGIVAESSGAAFFGLTGNASNSLAAGEWVQLVDVSAGDGFTCVSDDHSGTWCWGEGSLGQLGDGNGTDSTTAVKVSGAGGSGYLGTVQSLAAGEAFACGAMADGSVWCWGRNDAGQLGNGTIVDSNYPVQVLGVGGSGTLGGIVDVAAGRRHACAADGSGNVYCWGEGSLGQLGDGNGSDSSTPVQAIGAAGSGYALDQFATVSYAGSDGNIAWSNAWQELGESDGPTVGDVEVDDLHSGGLTCGDVWCLEIGVNGVITGKGVSRQVDLSGYAAATLSFDWQRITVTDLSASVLVEVSSDGGSWTTVQTLTDNGNVFTPQSESWDITPYISSTTSIRFIGSGTSNTWWYMDNIRIDASSASGYVLDDFSADSYSDDDGTVSWSAPWQELGESDGATIGVVEIDTVYCTVAPCIEIGDNGSVAGFGLSRPVDLTGYTGATLTYDWQRYSGANYSATMAVQVSSDGSSWTTLQTLGDGSTVSTPQSESWDITPYISSTTSIRFIASGFANAWWYFDDVRIDLTGGPSPSVVVGAGLDHSCAAVDGDASCWGLNSSGQVGDGTTTTRLAPVTVAGVGGSGTLTGIVGLDGGDTHSCGSDSSGNMYCWGGNGNEQLGGALPSSEGVAVWRESAGAAPIQSIYDDSSFGTAESTLTIGEFRIMRAAVSPTGDEAIVVGLTGGNDIAGMMWTNRAWAALPFNNVVDNITYSSFWSFDVAYESQSGDLMLVYDNGTSFSQSASYRVWNGSSWTAPSTISLPVSAEAVQLKLAADPTSDEMILAGSNNDSEDFALVWDGSSWGNSVALDSFGSGDDRTDVYVEYEQQSGDALVVYGNSSNYLYYRTWNGTWSSGSQPDPFGIAGDVRWTTMGADPSSDRIVVGVLTSSSEVWFVVWTGSTFTQSTVATTSANTVSAPQMAAAFEGTSGWAVVTYAEGDRPTPRYRTWSLGGWSGELSAPSIGADANSMMLYPKAGTDRIMLAVQDDFQDLHYLEWTGSAWASDNELDQATGETANQPFVFLWDVAGIGAGTSTSPVQVVGPGGSGTLADVAGIGLGGAHSCASLSGGAVYCWGQNDQGEVGDGSTTQRGWPTQVAGPGGIGTLDLADLVAGGDSEHTCSVRDGGQVWCWGDNLSGQFGDGTTGDSTTPVRNGEF